MQYCRARNFSLLFRSVSFRATSMAGTTGMTEGSCFSINLTTISGTNRWCMTIVAAIDTLAIAHEERP